MVRKFISLIVVAAAALLTGCATTTVPTNSVGYIQEGVVVQVNKVSLTAQNSTQWGVSGIASALTGVVANQLAQGKSYGARNALTAIGGAIGGIAGKVAIDSVGTAGYEYVVTFPKRGPITVTQPQRDGLFAVGTPVLVINTGGINRVVPSTAQVAMAQQSGFPAPAAHQAQPVAINVANAQSQQISADGRRVQVINGVTYYGAKVR